MRWWVLVLVGCAAEEAPIGFDRTPRVRVVQVQAPPATLTRTAQGTLEPVRDAWLTPLRPGQVVGLPVVIGDLVSAGATVVALDGREARAQLLQAKAGLAEATAALMDAERQRDRVLALGDAAAPSQVDGVETAVLRARAGRDGAAAQRDLAAVNLDHTTIDAPFDGVLVELRVEIGEVVGSQPVARVVDTSAAKVVVGLVQDEVGPATSAEAMFSVVAGGRRGMAERVSVAPAASPGSLTWRLELRVDDAPAPLGSPVEVVMELPPVHAGDGLLPIPAIVDGEVWAVEEGVARRVAVEVVAEVGGQAVVRGIMPGTMVVLHSADPLEDGVPVVPLEGS